MLEALWDIEVRRPSPVGEADYYGAVPYTLLAARQSGFLAAECYAAGVVSHIASKLGVVCCLCLAINDQEDACYYSVPQGLVEFVCPSVLSLQTRFKGYSTDRMISGLSQPLCRRCRRALGGYLYRQHGQRLPDDLPEIEYAAALTYIANFHGFRQRVERNAGNLSRLRFDPRVANSIRLTPAGYPEGMNP